MNTGFYQMGFVNPSKFTFDNEEKHSQKTIELTGSYEEQMKQIAPIIKENNIGQIFVSNEHAIPLEHMLNEFLITQYKYNPTNLIQFIYRKD